jgi:hypothetical protein
MGLDSLAMSIGDPCPKKKAGIFSGVEGRASSAARHALWVFGNDICELKKGIALASAFFGDGVLISYTYTLAAPPHESPGLS